MVKRWVKFCRIKIGMIATLERISTQAIVLLPMYVHIMHFV